MQVMRVLDLPTAIPLGAYLGGNYGQQAVLDKLNSVWNSSGSGVLFGQSAWGDRYAAFTQTITARDNEVMHAVERTLDVTLRPNKVLMIQSLDDLETVPPCMYQGILTMPSVRPLYDQGMIRGWGVQPEDLPQEDVVGRLLSNGTFSNFDPNWNREAPVTWVFKTGDPNYTFDELSIWRASREWIDDELQRQLAEGGDNLDITDIPNRMGKIRKLKKVN